MFDIIGGRGLARFSNLEVSRREVVRTPYGEPSGALVFGRIGAHPVVFLARHGHGHAIAPHEVNYRANVWALAERGAKAIVSVASVGGIRSDLVPGRLVIPHQIVDYTWGRKSTFHNGASDSHGPAAYIDFTEPYDVALRALLIDAAAKANVAVCERAVYAATQGPRLETAAEIDRLERDGADVVGMTGMPEAALARELDIPYAAIDLVSNHAAGRGESHQGISFESIQRVQEASLEPIRAIIERAVALSATGKVSP